MSLPQPSGDPCTCPAPLPRVDRRSDGVTVIHAFGCDMSSLLLYGAGYLPPEEMERRVEAALGKRGHR